MGALLFQVGNIDSTFSCKFNDAQLKYMVTRQELLATAKACKHFEQISCGCKIRIHTHHQKLMHIHMMHANLQEQQTCIFLNTEFVPSFVHITGRENIGADSLSQLLMLDQVPAETTHQLFAISNLTGILTMISCWICIKSNAPKQRIKIYPNMLTKLSAIVTLLRTSTSMAM